MLTKKIRSVLAAIKPILLLVLPALVFARGIIRPLGFVPLCFEMFAVYALGLVVARKNKTAGYVVHSVLIFLIEFQFVVMFFSNNFLSIFMLENIGNIKDLGGHAFSYVLSVCAALAVSFLPLANLRPGKAFCVALIPTFALAAVAYLATGLYRVSPAAHWVKLPVSAYFRAKINRIKAELRADESVKDSFRKDEVGDFFKKPEEIPARPNIILIFTEGLSEHILYDERNIMPNARRLGERSVSFKNYYNHTAATYRGIIGQLFSGYQQENLDVNRLVSMQSLLREKYGYRTLFINTEPMFDEFSDYLAELGFDEVRADKERLDGMIRSMSDRAAYEFLYETAEAERAKDAPFFLCIYTFGTHATFGSPHEKFGDGKDPALNKFHNADVQLGSFLERFDASDLSGDTVLIFTADHCMYYDLDFRRAFPDRKRAEVFHDTIPLFIYAKGLAPFSVDAGERNSLCMAPTVLDFLDFSGENYFLGESLFSPAAEDSFSRMFMQGFPYDALLRGEKFHRVFQYYAITH